MNDLDTELIKAKTSLIIYNFLLQNKKEKSHNPNQDSLLIYNESILASAVGVRKSTISDLINCKSLIRTETLFLLLNALHISFSEFALRFDNITDQEALAYREQLKEHLQELRRL